MQTFLPYEDFGRCAAVLDDKRLFKQVVECKQILQTLEKKRLRKEWNTSGEMPAITYQKFYDDGSKIPWENHPAVLMWEGYEGALKYYQLLMFKEWARRRWNFNIYTEAARQKEPDAVMFIVSSFDELEPHWLGDERLHKSHRAMLFWKDPQKYYSFGKYYIDLMGHDYEREAKPEYYWPVKKK
jgi:hypothetical protein